MTNLLDPNPSIRWVSRVFVFFSCTEMVVSKFVQPRGMTPLHVAVLEEKTSLVHLLIEARANPDAVYDVS